MDKISYALGIGIAQNLIRSGIHDINIDDFTSALKDTFDGKETQISPKEANQIMEEYFDKLQKEQISMLKKSGEDFLKEVGKLEGVKSTASGLKYKIITEGTGKQPTKRSRVKCHYEGRLIDGAKFDSSYDRGEPIIFSLEQVIPGWTEGLQLMKEGSKAELYIPYQLGYGERGAGDAIPPYAALVFTVELLEVL